MVAAVSRGYASRWIVTVGTYPNVTWCNHTHRTFDAAYRCMEKLRRTFGQGNVHVVVSR